MKTIKIFLPLFCGIISSVSIAQQATHIIKQGDNISSIARQYHVSVNDIFKLNNLADKNTLHIGQKIIIPSGKNITTTAVVVPTKIATIKTITTTAPVTNQHQIVAGDNLLKIAKQYHVTVQQIRDWNSMKNDAIRAGDFLYISKPQTGIVQQPIPTKKVETTPTEIKVVKTEPTKKTELIIQQTPQPIIKTVVDEKPIVKDVKPQPTAPVEPANTKAGDSYFEKQYSSAKNEIEGLSGTFKTIAGWNDSKYYVLLNNVESGTVVKISANNKSVYAKVLGVLPNIKEDNNLVLRVSNATAAALGVADKFTAKVNF